MLQIKCSKCKTWNNGGDYCTKCGTVISMQEQERLEDEIKKEKEYNKPKDKWQIFISKYKHHHNLILRSIFYMFYSVYLLFSLIGLVLAWIILIVQA